MTEPLTFAFLNLGLSLFFSVFWWKTKDGLSLALATWGFMLSLAIILEPYYA